MDFRSLERVFVAWGRKEKHKNIRAAHTRFEEVHFFSITTTTMTMTITITTMRRGDERALLGAAFWP